MKYQVKVIPAEGMTEADLSIVCHSFSNHYRGYEFKSQAEMQSKFEAFLIENKQALVAAMLEHRKRRSLINIDFGGDIDVALQEEIKAAFLERYANYQFNSRHETYVAFSAFVEKFYPLLESAITRGE